MKKLNIKKIKYIVLILVTIVLSNPLFATIYIPTGSNITWNTPANITDDIVIESGAILNIIGTQINLSSISLITVELGGKLRIEDATLTSIGDKWPGIIVKGDKSSTQHPLLGNQGLVSLEDAVIEHAECGVMSGTQSYTVNGVYLNGGGRICATNTIFRNNDEAVRFNEYVYHDPANHYAEVSNWSFFTDCEFIVNDRYCQSMVTLCGVKGIDFDGCTFSNTSGIPGYGIYSNNSSIFINNNGYWYPSGAYYPYYPQATTFNGFEVAIFLDYSGIRNSIILNAEFDNNTIGVVARLTNNLRLESSSFNVDEVGVVVNNSTFFNIENNVFDAMNPGEGFGIYFDEGRVEDNNYIRYNDFSNLCIANCVVGEFSNLLSDISHTSGLQFLCNKFSDNYDDITVYDWGEIRILQGSSNMGSAGNHFNASNYNIYNTINNKMVVYYCDMNNPLENPTSILGNVIVDHTSATSCVAVGFRGISYYPNPNIWYDDGRIGDLNLVYNDLKDQLVIAEENYQNNYGSETIPWKVYYEGDDSYEQQVIDYMEITDLVEAIDLVCRDAIHTLLFMPEFDYPEYKVWIARVGTPQMDFLLAECYLSENNIVTMDSVLNNMYIKYMDYDPLDIGNYQICLHYLAQWNLNGADSVYISQDAIDELTIIANGSGASAVLAKSILSQIIGDYSHISFPYLCHYGRTQGTEHPSMLPDNSTGINDVDNKPVRLSIVPNPTDNNVTISVNNDVIIQKFVLYDIYGKELYAEKTNQSKINIDLSAFSKGIYFITCQLNDGKSVTRKIIKK